MADYFGWDIGGVHLKAARLRAGAASGAIETRIRAFEIWKEPSDLAARLRALFEDLSGEHAVTMTAELSDVFASRAEGVRSVLRACHEALPRPPRVLDVQGRFLSFEEAMERPLEVAAANWMASARLASRARRSALLIDIGSTTTDIIPIDASGPRPSGRTDTERLVSGELVYTGILRTPPSSLTDVVPLHGGWCRVSPEHFTNMGDVYRILGAIGEEDYTVPTPDGRGRSREEALARLARLVCAEISTLGSAAVETIAAYLRERQIDRVASAIVQVLSRSGEASGAVLAGSGAFLAEAAARRAGLEVMGLADLLPGLVGEGWTKAAPAAAIAVLLAEEDGGLRFTS